MQARATGGGLGLNERRYWAFLSYSHQDRRWARWLHRALETYAVPKRLVGRDTDQGPVPRRFSPIFRDREELPVDAHLGARLQDALEHAAYLVVLCSPAAARSVWVEREIARFKALHGDERVLAVIVGGAPRASNRPGDAAEECFPHALRVQVGPDGALSETRGDPIAADLRPGGDGRRLGLLKLLAGMMQVSLDELVRRDSQRRVAQLGVIAAGSGVVALGMGGLAVMAVAARNEAVAQRRQAEGLVEFMVGDLRDRLEATASLDVLGSLADRAMIYYQKQASLSMDADGLGRRVRVLTTLGGIEEDRGELGKAASLFDEASASSAQLLAKDPNNPRRLFEHAEVVGHLGHLAEQRGQLDLAQTRMEDFVRLTDRLVAIDGPSNKSLMEQGGAYADLGVVLLQRRQPGQAVAYLRRGAAIKRGAPGGAPRDRAALYDLAQNLAWLADAERQAGDETSALRERQAEERIYLDFLKAQPSDNQALDSLAVNHVVRAQMLMASGANVQALAIARSAIVDADRAFKGDPGNAVLEEDTLAAHQTLGEIALASGALPEAANAAARAQSLAEALVKADATVVNWTGRRLGAARLLRIAVAARRAGTREACQSALAPIATELPRLRRLYAAHPDSPSLAAVTARAEIISGDFAALGGRQGEARTAWANALAILNPTGGGTSAGSSAAAKQGIADLSHRLGAQTESGRSPGIATIAGVVCGDRRNSSNKV